MVYVVDESLNGFSYREINQQLAKENGQLRQQLSQVIQENSNIKQEVHRRDVIILDLEHRVNELVTYQTKLNSIKAIISDVSIEPRSPIRALPPTEAPNIDNTTFSNPNSPEDSAKDAKENTLVEESLITASEHSTSSFDPEKSTAENPCETAHNDEPTKESGTMTNTTLDAVLNTILEENDSIVEEKVTMSEYHDSLDPHDVSSVPPLTAVPERTMHTPSIWNCLDPLDDMFESTPQRLSETARPSFVAETPVEMHVERPRRGRGRKIQAESRAKREVKFDEGSDPPIESRRYNLRKRSKT